MDNLSKGQILAREIITKISLAAHGNGLTYTDKFDLFGEIADYCEAKIQETCDEEMDDDDD